MSQYPSPYDPQYSMPGGYDPVGDLLRPARTAGILSIIFGALLLVCGGACGLASFAPFDQLPAEQLAELQQLESQIGMRLQPLVLAMGIIAMVPGILLIVLGILVRRGGMGSIITLMIISSVLILLLLFQLVMALVSGTQGDAAGAIGGLIFSAIPLALLGLMMYYLIGALRNASQLRALHDQQHAQYWQYQQNQQRYAQDPGQYGTPPPPPPPTSDPFDRPPQ